MTDVIYGRFVWHSEKDASNVEKHGVSFQAACSVFQDTSRIIAKDEAHSQIEERYFCIGRVGKRIATVRFTYRSGKIRILGAGYWRKGAQLYAKEEKNR